MASKLLSDGVLNGTVFLSSANTSAGALTAPVADDVTVEWVADSAITAASDRKIYDQNPSKQWAAGANPYVSICLIGKKENGLSGATAFSVGKQALAPATIGQVLQVTVAAAVLENALLVEVYQGGVSEDSQLLAAIRPTSLADRYASVAPTDDLVIQIPINDPSTIFTSTRRSAIESLLATDTDTVYPVSTNVLSATLSGNAAEAMFKTQNIESVTTIGSIMYGRDNGVDFKITAQPQDDLTQQLVNEICLSSIGGDVYASGFIKTQIQNRYAVEFFRNGYTQGHAQVIMIPDVTLGKVADVTYAAALAEVETAEMQVTTGSSPYIPRVRSLVSNVLV